MSTKPSKRNCFRAILCCFSSRPQAPKSQSPDNADTTVAVNIQTQSDCVPDQPTDTGHCTREIGLESMIQNFSILEISRVGNEGEFSFSDSDSLPNNYGPPVESFVSLEAPEEPAECSLSIYENLRYAADGQLPVPRRPITPVHSRATKLRRNRFSVPEIVVEVQSESAE